MKTLHDFISNDLRQHAQLVASGIPSDQALNIISYPKEINNLKESLEALSLSQIDELLLLLRRGIYLLKGKKPTFYMSGIVSTYEGLKIAFTDNVFGYQTEDVSLEELSEPRKEEILKQIRVVL